MPSTLSQSTSKPLFRPAGLSSALLDGRAWVAGTWMAGHDRLPVDDPATGEVIGCVAALDPAAADAAVTAAGAAFAPWRARLPADRGAVLRAWAAAMRRDAELLAVLMTLEQGKPVAESRAEIAYAAGFLDWFAAESERAYGETLPSHRTDSLLHVRMQPAGIAAAVTPWNFPSAMITRKAGAALAAGCPMIVVPAPETPFSALALARLGIEAGVPAGVFQVLTGDPKVLVGRLLDRPEVRALSFTGSTEVGRLLLGRAAETVKKVSMELGGHAPFVVFDDASLDLAVSGALAAKFATSGQDCLAANRIYVQRRAYEPFVETFGEAVRTLKVGHGLDPATDVGPMTKTAVADKCRAHIEDALGRGARLVAGGAASAGRETFVRPTVLADVTEDMLIARQETFGPVAAVLPFDTEAEVIRRANDTEMGLAAYLYTNDLRRTLRVTEALEYGMVGVNTASFTGPPVPFGGWKQSGLGREGSRHGLSEYMELKYVCFGDLAA
ncbi:MAG: NAD-dependent succinate-semialdehyde dehydrogenase [Parafilimonas terrae]|nr:NAD-dependent succinate-semialdehyde dehydrogenase [Parafilimonas terrae]